MFPHLRGSQAERVYQLAQRASPASLSHGSLMRARYYDAAASPNASEGLLSTSTVAVRSIPNGPLSRREQVPLVAGSDSCSSASSEVQQPAASAGEERAGLVKGAWSADEDALLLLYVQEHGSKDWGNIQHVIKGFNRSGKSCRLRYVNHLRGGLKRTSLSRDEEQRVLQLHAIHGNKWAKIAAELPGRTDNEVKNFWNGRQKRLLRVKELASPAAPSGQAPPLGSTRNSRPGARSWMSSTSERPAPLPPWPQAPFLGHRTLPAPMLPAPLRGRSPSSSAGSTVNSSSTPLSRCSSEPWPSCARLPPLSQRMWVPPLVIPEVPPLEDEEAPTPAELPAALPPSRAWGLPEAPLDSSMYPLYRPAALPLSEPLSQAARPKAWGHHDARWPFGSLPLPNALSPPPRPPLVHPPTPNVDAFLVSPLEADKDGAQPDWPDSTAGPPSRKRAREESPCLGAPHGGPWQAQGPAWNSDCGVRGAERGRPEKRSQMEDSVGECNSGISFDTAGCGDAFSTLLFPGPALSPGASSWPAWLDEASPRHRLEAEAAAASLYPTATAFLAAVQPEWGPRWALPPLVPMEELGTCVGEGAREERLKKIASWSNFLCAAAGL